MQATRSSALTTLRDTIRRLERNAGAHAQTARGHLAFGCPALDAHLPGGGLEGGALHEVVCGRAPADEAAATAFVAAIAARTGKMVLWCGGGDLYAPGLAGLGLGPDRLIMAAARGDAQILAVMEEGLRHRVLGAVVGELKRLDLLASRRLQLAAAKAGVMALALRRGGAKAREDPNAAVTRWRVSPAPAAAGLPLELERGRWRLELLRCRGGGEGIWIVECPDASGHIRLPSTLDDRGARAPDRLRAAG